MARHAADAARLATVTYRRGGLTAELSATIGKSMYDQDDGEGIVIRSQVRDFLIDTQSLLNSVIGSLPRVATRSQKSTAIKHSFLK